MSLTAALAAVMVWPSLLATKCLRISSDILICSGERSHWRLWYVTSGKSIQSSVLNLIAGCSASYAICVASGLATHLNVVT